MKINQITENKGTTEMNISYEVNWEPLENFSNAWPEYIKCEDFMYMGSVNNGEPQKNIHLYKHINTRKYINISDGGLLYTYGQNEYSPLINFSYEEKIKTILEL